MNKWRCNKPVNINETTTRDTPAKTITDTSEIPI